jgi:hypothetical protein
MQPITPLLSKPCQAMPQTPSLCNKLIYSPPPVTPPTQTMTDRPRTPTVLFALNGVTTGVVVAVVYIPLGFELAAMTEVWIEEIEDAVLELEVEGIGTSVSVEKEMMTDWDWGWEVDALLEAIGTIWVTVTVWSAFSVTVTVTKPEVAWLVGVCAGPGELAAVATEVAAAGAAGAAAGGVGDSTPDGAATVLILSVATEANAVGFTMNGVARASETAADRARVPDTCAATNFPAEATGFEVREISMQDV